MRLHCPGLTFSLKMQFLIFFLARSVCPVWRPTHSFWGLYPELLLLSVKSQLPFPAFILFGLFLSCSGLCSPLRFCPVISAGK